MDSYEINVSLNGQRLFVTDKRSLHTYEDAKKVYSLLAVKFPESEGYSISVTEWHEAGYQITM